MRTESSGNYGYYDQQAAIAWGAAQHPKLLAVM